MPFGYNYGDWDQTRHTAQEIEEVLNQLKMCNDKDGKAFTIIFTVSPEGIADVLAAVAKVQGLKLPKYRMHYAFKEGTNMVAFNNYLPAVEISIIAVIGEGALGNCFTDGKSNPLLRANMRTMPSVKKAVQTKDSLGEIVNSTEKHPSWAKYFAQQHCHPGSWVFVLGSATNAFPIGIMEAGGGRNIYAIELEERQFTAGLNRVQTALEEHKKLTSKM